jgi:hypothetical protein
MVHYIVQLDMQKRQLGRIVDLLHTTPFGFCIASVYSESTHCISVFCELNMKQVITILNLGTNPSTGNVYQKAMMYSN